MGGLSSSRHAPLPRHWTRTSNTTSTLTVPPAPITTNTHTHTHADDLLPPSPTDTRHLHHPDSPATAPRRRPHPTAPHELARYTKIVRRLRWKLPFLAQGYRLAVDRVGADPAAVGEAELMFKLDFFEYYMLIERALVHLLGVFGVEIPRGHGYGHGRPHAQEHEGGDGGREGHGHARDAGGTKGLTGSIWRDGAAGEAPRHRYHANVLAALDSEENPLHQTLGTGEVRTELGRAKDLRNRWKTAGEDEHEPGPPDRRGKSPAEGAEVEERQWRTRKVAAPLDSYRLEHMLEVIFAGFDEAFGVAELYVKGASELWAQGDTDMVGEDGSAIDWAAAVDDDDQWEFMVDAMDWEAV